MSYTDGEEYVDKRPPDAVCTWCGHSECADCATSRAGEATE